ncbi:hypothetical protein RHOFW510R12_07130 [Rhodanobacter sp. FW510-R12]|uniref:M56 family metallopeptidase n=1 Tax=unclassified Rhodanobacter TaxID=2621553 RepID=UPI0007AA02CD|nr:MULTISPECIES: M56 family metallopeptidase [unclassified Rhodanobacter]KZC17215.1 hypothetical protein RHOFW104R8_12190 [Rhodanobacter sp. FW104-R8]KZC29071.1 hypothetical protein RhoFW510T8_07900 [Rhodanobacter sp. FW510-T8]KZC33009.1 hypothetical protein RhoFW510R10_09755 [Rhodanobacter sp. FW510-R10]
MDTLPLLLESARVIGWALVHFIWQGALLGLVYAAVRVALPRGEARYRFGLGVLVVLAVCPLLTAWRLLQAAPPLVPLAADMVAATAGGPDVTVAAAWASGSGFNALLPWLVLAWLLGVLLLSLRAWRQWRTLKALVRVAESMPRWQAQVTHMAQRFGLRRHVTVLCSKVIATPALVGWIRPVILLPMAVACRFPCTQIELILAHELAHLQRWDPLVNLFQVILETLHFYHPVVHWISRDVRNEREICCDELALSASGGSRHVFVTALAELGELRERHGSLLLAASGGVLLDRVQHMIAPASRAPRLHTSARFVALLVGAVLAALALRLESGRMQLQRGLDESIMQVQSILAPSWLPLSRSRAMWLLPDLAPAHAAVIRPVVEAAAVPTDNSALPPEAIDTALVVTDPLPRRAFALAPIQGGEPARIGGQVEHRVASMAAVSGPLPVHIRQPVYPPTALARGIEGQVVVEFGLAPDGRVQDLRVISAEPAGVFEQAALQAVHGWLYSANAGAMPQRRYRQTMVFTLNADAARNVPSGASVNEELRARIDCRVVIGTHICRWPDAAGPQANDAAMRAGRQ